MKLSCWLVPALLLPAMLSGIEVAAQDKAHKASKISWKKIILDRAFRSEGVGVADVNKDGKPDVIVGDCWYEAPKEEGGAWQRHILREDRSFKPTEYSDSFACFTDDFNGDGYPDVIVIPFPGKPCYWYENPGAKGGKWTPHLLTTSACNETPIYVDLFKTGKKILVMGWNPPKDAKDPKKGNYDDRGEMCYFLPGKDPTQPWQRVSISGPSEKGKTIPGTARFAHGLGHGDVNGDGRIDVIAAQGWWEQPEKAGGKPWKFHAANISGPCADMYTYDMTGARRADILSTSAHNYGFWWSEQKSPNTFVQRALFPNPFEVAKALPASLPAQPKILADSINKWRSDQLKCAPLVFNAELCVLAEALAVANSKGSTDSDLEKVGALDGKYKGKIIEMVRTTLKANAERKDIEALGQTILANRKIRPGFEIGVGMANAPDSTLTCIVLIGDRGKFSLPSQTHALECVDIDGDGLKDLVTGRRWWAHGPKGDVAPNDPADLYWFQAKRGKDGIITFTPHLIDDDSGVGTHFAVADMNGDGLPDIVISNKRGVFVFLQVHKE